MNDKKKVVKKAKEEVNAYQNKKEQIPSDPMGSYTGNPLNYETPEQDADDL